MEIRIAKTLCERVKNGFRDGWYIQMPQTSNYFGYKFYVSDYYIDFNSRFAEIKSNDTGYLFVLEKSEKVRGKRFARYALKFEDLAAEFAEHSSNFYTEDLPQALAYVKAYANNGSHSAGEVLFSYFCVGSFDKTWFYENDYKRRRLNTHGVRILKTLEPNEAAEMKEKVNRYYKLKRITRDFDDCYIDYENRLFYKAMQSALKPDVFDTIVSKFEEINSIIDKEAANSKIELEEMKQYFNNYLTKKEITQ